MNIGINNFNNEDLNELSKVWYNLSDNMRIVIAEALGGKHNLSTLESIMYGFNKDNLNRGNNTNTSIKMVNKNDIILKAEQIEMFTTLAENMTIFTKFLKEGINNIEKIDDDLTDLNNED